MYSFAKGLCHYSHQEVEKSGFLPLESGMALTCVDQKNMAEVMPYDFQAKVLQLVLSPSSKP